MAASKLATSIATSPFCSGTETVSGFLLFDSGDLFFSFMRSGSFFFKAEKI